METNAKHTQFKRRNSLRNRSTIYAKVHTYLRYFGSRFTQKSVWARTHARSDTRNFYAVILGPIRRYETDLRFTLKFVPIYAVLVHVLHKNPPEPEHAHDRTRVIFTP
jgi:hypothetical protein